MNVLHLMMVVDDSLFWWGCLFTILKVLLDCNSSTAFSGNRILDRSSCCWHESSPLDSFFFLGGVGLLPMILKVLLDSKPEVALEIVIAAKGKEWRMSSSCEVLDVVSPHLHTALSLSVPLWENQEIWWKLGSWWIKLLLIWKFSIWWVFLLVAFDDFEGFAGLRARGCTWDCTCCKRKRMKEVS